MSEAVLIAIVGGVLAALTGGGGVVAWLRYKLDKQKYEVETVLRGFEALLNEEKQRRIELEGQIEAIQEQSRADVAYIEVLVAHIWEGKPPPPPPRNNFPTPE